MDSYTDIFKNNHSILISLRTFEKCKCSTYLQVSYIAFTGSQASDDDGVMWVKVRYKLTG